MTKEAMMVPIPKKMKALGRDARGYPIPFIILRNKDGAPNFTINDAYRQRKALVEKRCPICGTKLDKLLWFVGGPLSAFDERGAYHDTAMHHECMTYALQVCPYLAASQYLGSVDLTKAIRKVDHPDRIYVDTTMIPGLPPLLVAVASARQTIKSNGPLVPAYVIPARPYIFVEYWRGGRRLSEAEGKEVLNRLAKSEVKR